MGKCFCLAPVQFAGLYELRISCFTLVSLIMLLSNFPDLSFPLYYLLLPHPPLPRCLQRKRNFGYLRNKWLVVENIEMHTP